MAAWTGRNMPNLGNISTICNAGYGEQFSGI